MPIRIYKKTSAGRRFSSVNLNTEVTKKEPEKSLTRALTKSAGRNHHGKITTRGRGGGAKRLYRVIDFRRLDRDGIIGGEHTKKAVVRLKDGDKIEMF